MKKNYTAENLILGAIILAAAIWHFYPASNPADSANANSQQQDDSSCEASLDCWAGKFQSRAGRDCEQPIERLAKYDFKWTNEFLEPILPKARWLDQTRGTLTFVGENIKFENGFGAWIIYQYECDYDPSTRTVLDARAWPRG